MGRWFARFLLEEGYQVILTGRNENKLREAGAELNVETATNLEAVTGAGVILLSVSLDSLETVIEQLAPHLRPEQIIIDIASVKVLPVEAMHRHIKQGRTLGVHPMFGPGAKSIAHQNFVLTPTSEAENALAGKVREFLEAREARVTTMTPQEHDEIMAVVLGLSHFIALVSADTLANSDKLKLTRAVSGTTYRALLKLVESVITEDPDFYASLQMSLANLPELEELFEKNAGSWLNLVRNRDRAEFARRMDALRSEFERRSG